MAAAVPLTWPSWCRVPVVGDGNCAFYSLGCSLNWEGFRDQDLATQVRIGRSLRQRLLGGQEEAWGRFFRDRGFEGLAPALVDVLDPHVYADDYVLNFVAWRLGLRVVVLAGTDRYEFGEGDVCVTLAYFEDTNHFESVVCRTPRPPAEAEAVRRCVARIARTARRSPPNVERLARDAAVPCARGFCGVFFPSSVPAAVT